MVSEATTTTTRLTYEEYLETPETMIRCEVVDGEVICGWTQSLPSNYIGKHQRSC